MINDLTSLEKLARASEKEIDPKKLRAYKLKARLLALVYSCEDSVNCWWVDIGGDTRLIIHDPKKYL